MALGHGAAIVRDGLVLHLDAANPRSRLGSNLITNKSLSQFPANQNVTVTKVGNAIFATSNQNTSTPGVWPIGSNGGWITVSANTQYTFRVLASVVSGSNAYLYVNGNVTGNLVWQGNAITSTHQWVENTFNTGSNTQLKVGILWSGPTTGSTIMIEDVGLHKTDSWYDLSGKGNKGTLINGPSFTPLNNGVMNFDGVDDYINLGNITTQNLSGMVICKIYSYNDYTALLDKLISNGSWRFHLYQGKLLFGIRDSTNTYSAIYTDNDVVNLNTWYHLAFVYNYSLKSIELFVNGVNVKSGTFSIVSASTSQEIFIARAPNNSVYSNMSIGNVLLYNRVLSITEIKQNFEALRGRYGI